MVRNRLAANTRPSDADRTKHALAADETNDDD
jgi:hypothetical protein